MFHVQFCQEGGPGESWSPLLDLESREDIFHILSRQRKTAHDIITVDFQFYFHGISHPKESVSKTEISINMLMRSYVLLNFLKK